MCVGACCVCSCRHTCKEPYTRKHVSEYVCVLLVEMCVHAVISVIEGFAKTFKINLQRKALPLAVGHILLAGMMI